MSKDWNGWLVELISDMVEDLYAEQEPGYELAVDCLESVIAWIMIGE